MYLKVLLSIAKNRNEEVPKIFYQFKVMEFLYKQLDLEFEITQIQRRFREAQEAAFKEKSDRPVSGKGNFKKTEVSTSSGLGMGFKLGLPDKLKHLGGLNMSREDKLSLMPKLNFGNFEGQKEEEEEKMIESSSQKLNMKL